MESFRHIGQKVERRHRDVLNVVVLHKCKLLHPLVEYKGDAVVEECLPKHLLNKISKDCFSGVKLYQKVESSVRLHILKDSTAIGSTAVQKSQVCALREGVR